MLLQFTVENFRSFKNSTVLSLEASSDNTLLNNCVVDKKKKYLKTISIFGANASGKSNIFKALTSAIMMIRLSNNRQIGRAIENIDPFRFNDQAVKAPTSFEFVFIAKNKKKYVYGFSATRSKVVTEYLYVFNTSKASTIFERNGEDYHFTSPALKKKIEPLTERNTQNKLFLATATLWNCEETKDPYLWFEESINTFPFNYDSLLPYATAMYDNDKTGSLKKFATNILREADINIEDYEIESKDIPVESLPKELQMLASLGEFDEKGYKIETVHLINSRNGEKRYNLPLNDESNGTQRVFSLIPIFKRAFETGETLCIDEFDSSLHPFLLEYLIGLFNNPSINKKNAQLIISTHNLSVFSLERFRRDQIYFVEKNRDTGESELYSLDEFSPRKKEDIRKSYLLGRYGSIPIIAEEADLWR